MAWVTKGKRRYYYRSRRVGGRVVREYYGCGPLAEMAAHLMDMRRRARTARDREAAQFDDVDAGFRQLHAHLDRAAAAHLLAAGYYRHDRGPWRKRRGT
jgi:hypothetical protein